MQPQIGAIGQAAQLEPLDAVAMNDMVKGRRPMVPMDERVRRMAHMRKKLGDEDMNKLIEQLLMQEAPRLDAEQGGIKGLLQLLQRSGVMGGQPPLQPQEMLDQIRQKR